MKKLLVSILIVCGIVLCGNVTISAEAANIGEAVGALYSTDIKAVIDNIPIHGYNIGGKTAIVLEDLMDGYGFAVTYDDNTRIITANSTVDVVLQNRQVSQSETLVAGNAVGHIYATNIKAYVNGSLVPSYNIQGKTAVCIEDLGNTAGSVNEAYGYSDYYMNAIWNQKTRTVELHVLRSNTEAVKLLANEKKMGYQFSDGIVTFTDDPNRRIGFGGKFDGTEKRILPVKTVINGKESAGNFVFLFAGQYLYFDLARLKNELDSAQPVSADFEKTIQSFMGDTEFYTTRIDIPSGTVLWRSSKDRAKAGDALVRINFDGNYRDIGLEMALADYSNCKITMVEYKKEDNSLFVTRRNAETEKTEIYRIDLTDNTTVLVG